MQKVILAWIGAIIFIGFVTNSVNALPVGLVSYWQFDENNGTTLNDSLGSNDGQIFEASWTSGLVGSALQFDGINDIVNLPNISGYSDFTMAAWFKPNNIGDSLGIFQTGMGYIRIEENISYPTGVYYLITEDRAGGSGNRYDFRYNYDLLPEDLYNRWHYAVLTGNSDNSDLSAYLDGNLVGNLSWKHSGWSSTLNYTVIGALKASLWSNNNEGAYFAGLIDEVYQFNRALSAEEVSIYYQSGLQGRTLYDPIPEPTTMLLLGPGLLGLLGIWRWGLKRRS